jgi:hypothetical protein
VGIGGAVSACHVWCVWCSASALTADGQNPRLQGLAGVPPAAASRHHHTRPPR